MFQNPNPIAIENIFNTGRNIYWYGIVIAIGVLVAYFLAYWDAKRRKLNPDIATDMVIWALIPGIICARLYYVVFDPAFAQHYTDFWSVFKISDGGLGIYGGVIGGAIGLFAYSKFKKIKFVTILDIAVPSLAIGQAFGRWGNFFNQEAFGLPVTNPDMQWFPYALYCSNPKGGFSPGWFQATFFYESAWCLLICIFIILYRKRQRFAGECIALYFALYGLERCLVELLRTDQLLIPGTDIAVSHILSALLFMGAVAILILGYIKHKNKQWMPATPGSIYYHEPLTKTEDIGREEVNGNDVTDTEADPVSENDNNETDEI